MFLQAKIDPAACKLCGMTPEGLIAEGRRLQRRTILLSPTASGVRAAIWYPRDPDYDPDDDEPLCWLSVEAKFIPSFDRQGWLSIFTDDSMESDGGGRVEVSASPYKADGVSLFAEEITVLPPLDAVLARASPAVDAWLKENDWGHHRDRNRKFEKHPFVEAYEAIMVRENQLYAKRSDHSNVYATLGGWHTSWPEGDWHDLLDAKLLVHTYEEAEPWIEAWQMPTGEFKVIQRIT
jgi:hypothetical protein